MTDEEQVEQEKLTRRERRAQAKGGNPEGDENLKDRNQRLRAEAAAKRRKLRRVEREAAASEGLDTGERVDDALVRSANVTGKFLRENFVWLQWIVIGGLVAGMGLLIFNYKKNVEAEAEGGKVASVLSSQFGRIASAETESPADSRLVDPRPEFSSEEEKEKSALEAWQGLNKVTPELALMAKLGEANVLFDQEKYSEARKVYEAASHHPQAKLNELVKGRALEGIGFTWEAEKKYPEALKAYAELAQLEAADFKKLSVYHQARVNFQAGNKDKALESLKKLDEELSKNEPMEGPGDYLGLAVRDLLMTVDPTKAVEEQERRQALQMEEMMKRIQEMQKQNAGAGGLNIPGLPEPPPPALSTESKAPESSVPDQAPTPVAPAPVAPAPVAPAPVAPAPVAPAPVAPKAAPSPVAPAPIAPAPQPAPVAPAPLAPKAPSPAAPGPAVPAENQ